MNQRFSLSSTAALIAEPARAAMLTVLLDARPRCAGELAREANVSAQSASMHLSQLCNGGFLHVTRQGPHRYYSIAGRHIAHAIEALGAISTSPNFKPARADRDLCYARTCYDHLAGELGVRLAAALEQKQVLVLHRPAEYTITRDGEKFLSRWQIDVNSLRNARRSLAWRCLDWTEKRYHLAGALGAAICDKFLERRWIRGRQNPRGPPVGEWAPRAGRTSPARAVSLPTIRRWLKHPTLCTSKLASILTREMHDRKIEFETITPKSHTSAHRGGGELVEPERNSQSSPNLVCLGARLDYGSLAAIGNADVGQPREAP